MFKSILFFFFIVYFLVSLYRYNHEINNLSTGDMFSKVVSSEKTWKKVIRTEKKIVEQYRRGLFRKEKITYRYIVVKVDDQEIKVLALVGVPHDDECLPVIIKKLANGNKIVEINVEEYRHGATYGECS